MSKTKEYWFNEINQIDDVDDEYFIWLTEKEWEECNKNEDNSYNLTKEN